MGDTDIPKGLEGVTVTHRPALRGEGQHLLAWVRDCLGDCPGCPDCEALKAAFEVRVDDADGAGALTMEWSYRDGRAFHWHLPCSGGLGEIRARLGRCEEEIPTSVQLLPPERALSEAFFF